MKLKKCPNNHYYDANEYERCPHCFSDETVESIAESIRASIKESIKVTPPELDANVSSSYMAEPAAQPAIIQGSEQVVEKTGQNPVVYVPLTEPRSLPTASLPEAPLTPPEPNDMKTVAVWNAPNGTEPVVGWLVCVKGIYFGQSFTLKTGNNTVGRSMEMNVPLAQVSTVSRIRHCIITYEPEKQEFFVQPGESGGLTYLNGNLVLSFTKINSRDKIKLGSCEFMFYPLCCGKFNWGKFI